MSCTFETTPLGESLKKVVDSFQTAITKNINENNKTVFENLSLSKTYLEGINIVNSQITTMSSEVNDCIQKYNILVENMEIKKKDNTSNIMYSDTKQIVKTNLHHTVWLTFGIMLLCFFLYKIK